VRLILTILLLFSLTLACLGDCLLLVSFSLNRSFIARNLCEKKDVPRNSCQGCCQLRKQLNREERKAESLPAKNVKEFDEIQLVPASSPADIRAPRNGEMSFPPNSFAASSLLGSDIDHPPEISPVLRHIHTFTCHRQRRASCSEGRGVSHSC
jgi:hypothetical protein